MLDDPQGVITLPEVREIPHYWDPEPDELHEPQHVGAWAIMLVVGIPVAAFNIVTRPIRRLIAIYREFLFGDHTHSTSR